jgi:phosphonate transport system substrate-binding protein
MEIHLNTALKFLLPLLSICFVAAPVLGQDSCTHRGDLDALYCDANKDLVADAPTDPQKWKNPSTLVFTYAPVEDPAVYENIFKPFTEHLAQCTGKRVAYFQVQSNAAQIEAMRAGRLHVANFSTGPTNFAVNIAGAVPFAMRGENGQIDGYNLIVVVKKSSSFQKLSDLKGKKVAHTSPSSNSGHLAPMALFPKEGILPGKDYPLLFSGKHDQSAIGVQTGDYDAAAVASDVYDRLVRSGRIKGEEMRIIYRSEKFPSGPFAYAHDLAPSLAQKIKECFFNFTYPEAMRKAMDNADRFLPIDYKKDWALVREVAQAAGEKFTRDAYEKQQKK